MVFYMMVIHDKRIETMTDLEEKDYILKFKNEKLIVKNGRDTLDITYDNDLHKVI